jgi:hypothetical protein
VKFRTKIWMLPLSAAIVFVIGVAVSYLVGARTLDALQPAEPRRGARPAALRQTDQGLEQFRLLLQSAAVEGDADKLKDVQSSVDRIKGVLTGCAHRGQVQLADDLLGAFNAYQSAALGAAKAMLAKTDAGDQVKRMQAAQARLDTLAQARAGARRGQQRRAAGASRARRRRALWVTLVIGVAVLAVLGLASRLVISSVWRDLGEEPRTLHLLTRRIAEGDLQVEAQGRGRRPLAQRRHRHHGGSGCATPWAPSAVPANRSPPRPTRSPRATRN